MQMLTIIRNQLKLLFNNRVAIFAIISAPLLLTFLFTYSSSHSKTDLYIADSDNSASSQQFIRMLEKDEDVNVIHVTENELKKKIDNQSIDIGFIIEPEFGQSLLSGNELKLQMIQNYSTGEGALLEQHLLNEANTLSKINRDSQLIATKLDLSYDTISHALFNQIKDSSNLTTHETSTAGSTSNADSVTTSSTKLLGFLVMFLWFVIIQGLRTLVEEKSNHTFERIQTTSTSYYRYIISKIIATYLFGLILTIIILLIGKNVFHTSLLEHLTSVVFLLSVYLFALTGIIMIFVPHVKNQQSFTVIGSVLMALTGILGGSFFSIDEIASNTMKLVSKFTPESWAIQSISNVAFSDARLKTQIQPVIILITIGILGFIISYLTIKIKIRMELSHE